jgi:hypothetical protein
MMKQFDLQHSHRRLVIGQTGPTRNFGAWSCELPVSEFLRAAILATLAARSYLLELAEEEDKKMPR